MTIPDLDLDDDLLDAKTIEECWAWRRVPSVIGGTTHTHVCRQPQNHPGHHTCTCTAGTTF